VRGFKYLISVALILGILGSSVPAALADPSNGVSRYNYNPLTVETTTVYLSAQSPNGELSRCAAVDRVDIVGLRDGIFAQKIADDFSDQQDWYLMTAWGVDHVDVVDQCEIEDADSLGQEAQQFSLVSMVLANFSNVLSLVSVVPIQGSQDPDQDSDESPQSTNTPFPVAETTSETTYPHGVPPEDGPTLTGGYPVVILNLRLDTGENLNITDVFVEGTDLAAKILGTPGGQAPYLGPMEAIELDPSVDFTFTSTGARIYPPGVPLGTWIPYAPAWQDVAIFSLAASARDLYLTQDPPLPAPPVVVEEPPIEVEPPEPASVPDMTQSSVAAESVGALGCGGVGSTQVTAMVKDQFGRPMPGVMVDFRSNKQSELSEQAMVTDDTGTAVVTLRSKIADTVYVAASIYGHDLAGSPWGVSFVPACSASRLSTMSFAVNKGAAYADGRDGFKLTVYARDINGSPVAGLANKLRVNSPSGLLATTSFTDQGYGVYTTWITSDVPGVYPFHVTFAASDLDVRDLPRSPSELIFLPTWVYHMSVSPQSMVEPYTADGVDSFLMTVKLSSRHYSSPVVPLTGQKPWLSLSARTSDGNEVAAGKIDISSFTEVEPGLYTVRVKTTIRDDYTFQVQWLQAGATSVTSQEITASFR